MNSKGSELLYFGVGVTKGICLKLVKFDFKKTNKQNEKNPITLRSPESNHYAIFYL